ncbi:sigma-70 domain-containing protein [Ktedonobacter racemifer]|uniref:sigma-70 domain-containing protein n=1 Tax=Ktedonobacter racemifer TaxID=363277 RepID=UPI0012F9489A
MHLLFQELGREPDIQELAQAMGMDIETTRELVATPATCTQPGHASRGRERDLAEQYA